MTVGGHAMRSGRAARTAATFALAGALVIGHTPSLVAAPVALSEGRAATADQRSGEKVVYTFDAAAGRTYLIEIEQHGLDFTLSIEAPDGDSHDFNSPLLRDEPEFALIERAIAGRYRLTVSADEPTNAVGRHVVSVSPLDTAADPRSRDAWHLMSDGARANQESRGRDALASYERAATLWHELGDLRREAQAVYSAAMIRYWSADFYDWDGAAKQAAAAAALYDRLGARGLYADARLTSGYSLMEVAQGAGADARRAFDDALAALRESYAVHDAIGDAYGLAHVENFTGLAYYNRGQTETQDFRQAEIHYRHAIELFAKLGEWREELLTRQNLALISIDEGRAASAARMFEGILADIPDDRDQRFRGIVLANLGVAYRNSGDFDSALRALTEAVKIDAAKNEFGREGFALLVLGGTYLYLGQLERAGEYLRQALQKSEHDSRVLSSVLSALGHVAYRKGDYAAALEWHRRSVEGTASVSDRVRRETFVARDLVGLRRFDEAVKTGGAALARADTSAITRADSALEVGYAYLGLGDAKEADRNFATALAVYDAGALRTQQAESLRGRALAARARGDLRAATRYGEQALDRIEALRTTVGAPELRAYYSAAHRDYYELQIDLLVGAHTGSGDAPDSALAALSVSERARARMLFDLLAEASVRLDRGVPQAVLDRERELYDELGALRTRRDRLLENSALDRTALDPVIERMNAIENELALVAMDARRNAAVRAGSSAVAAPLSARDIQTLLDDRTVLLQYALGAERSFAWVVTRDSVRLADLAGRETIEAAARRVREGLKTYGADRADTDLAAHLSALSDLVLAPIAPYFGTHERVLVAPDGALGYIPFGVLPIVRDGTAVPMLSALEVVNVPSMSVLAAQRRRAEATPSKTLAVFADPVFSANDPRLALGPAALTAPSLGQEDVPRLSRLAATGAEASAIAALVPPASSLVATGLEASRERVLSAPLADYRIVHFATHGLVDSQYPGLSALALSRVDAAGHETNGMLRLQDIYRLSLNADLVVLSGCDTALGREIRGEGLIGLVDGFLYAGARSLVVSLWQVPDRATSELMARFYTYVLKDGVRPAEALRRAQRSIAAERRWSDPYFWGAFIVLGDS